MSVSDLLSRLQSMPPGADLDWGQIREELHDEHQRATTTKERETVLGIFTAIMDQVERSIADEDLDNFRKVRGQDL